MIPNIIYNPYRFIGLSANFSARDFQSKKNKLQAYAKVGRAATSDYDLVFFPVIDRNQDNLERAFSQVEQPVDRINHALFWLVVDNNYDKMALEYLKNKDIKKSFEILSKATKQGDQITDNNITSVNNFSTLCLLFQDMNWFLRGFDIKLKLIESSSFDKFINILTDDNYVFDRSIHMDFLLDNIINYMMREKGYMDIALIDVVDDYPIIKKHLIDKLSNAPIHDIERWLEITKNSREEQWQDCYHLGLKLYEETKDNLKKLNHFLDNKDVKFVLLKDAVAQEINYCAVAYVNRGDQSKEKIDGSINILQKALLLSPSKKVVDNIQENILEMQESKKYSDIANTFDEIKNHMDMFMKTSPTIDRVPLFLENSKKLLLKIKNKLGSRNENYIDISSAVVFCAHSAIINILNDIQNKPKTNNSIKTNKEIFSKAFSLYESLKAFDMNQKMRQTYMENLAVIKEINKAIIDQERSENTGCGAIIFWLIVGWFVISVFF